MAPREGFEPSAYRLTAECSTVELPWNIHKFEKILFGIKYYHELQHSLCCGCWATLEKVSRSEIFGVGVFHEVKFTSLFSLRCHIFCFIHLLNVSDKRTSSVLLSQAAARQVPSTLEDFTSVFGMGTGVTPPPSPLDSSLKGFRTFKTTYRSSFNSVLSK